MFKFSLWIEWGGADKSAWDYSDKKKKKKRLRKEIFLQIFQRQIKLRRHRNQQAKAKLPLHPGLMGSDCYSVREPSLLHSCPSLFSSPTSPLLPHWFPSFSVPLQLSSQYAVSLNPGTATGYDIIRASSPGSPFSGPAFALKALDMLGSHSE